MSFGDHLDELRRRILWSLAAPLPVFIVVFLVSDTLIKWILLPVYRVLRAHDLPTELQVLSPPEFVLTKLKLSVITAFVVCGPWLLWQAWNFIAPGLYRRERRFVYFLLPGSAILTAAGTALLYFVMLPLLLHVLVMFAADIEVDPGAALGPALEAQVTGNLAATSGVPILTSTPEPLNAGDVWIIAPSLGVFTAVTEEDGTVRAVSIPKQAGGTIDQTFRVSFVVNFTLVLLLGIVIAFQMPLVIVLLGWLNLVSVDWLRRRRRYALGLCGVVAAVITPAEAVSMILMLVPLYALYELGILLLIIAPASRVSEGLATGFRFQRRSKSGDQSGAGGHDSESS